MIDLKSKTYANLCKIVSIKQMKFKSSYSRIFISDKMRTIIKLKRVKSHRVDIVQLREEKRAQKRRKTCKSIELMLPWTISRITPSGNSA